jgi:transmembrane sensor
MRAPSDKIPQVAPSMTPGVPISIDDAAVAWFVRLHDEQATSADRADFEAWLASDRAHAEAWREIERIWGGLGQIAQPSTTAEPQAAPVVTLRRSHPARNWHRFAAAAVVLLALMAGWQLLPVGMLADHRTDIGERRMIRLEDGSQVELGPGSALDVAFAGERRRVRLIAGQAFFTVARDTGRPFVVEARQGQIEVLGTAFDVKMIDDAVSVAVTHNAVAVSASGGKPVRLSQGQAVSYDGGGVSAVRAADLDAVEAWRHDQLVFHDAPLSNVLTELARYRRGRVQLLGKDLGSRRVTAVFDARRPDAAIETIAHSLDLRMLRATSLFIALADW